MKLADLPRRQRQTVELLAQGYGYKEIAAGMFISLQTVKNTLHEVFRKIGAFGSGASIQTLRYFYNITPKE